MSEHTKYDPIAAQVSNARTSPVIQMSSLSYINTYKKIMCLKLLKVNREATIKDLSKSKVLGRLLLDMQRELPSLKASELAASIFDSYVLGFLFGSFSDVAKFDLASFLVSRGSKLKSGNPYVLGQQKRVLNSLAISSAGKNHAKTIAEYPTVMPDAEWVALRLLEKDLTHVIPSWYTESGFFPLAYRDHEDTASKKFTGYWRIGLNQLTSFGGNNHYQLPGPDNEAYLSLYMAKGAQGVLDWAAWASHINNETYNRDPRFIKDWATFSWKNYLPGSDGLYTTGPYASYAAQNPAYAIKINGVGYPCVIGNASKTKNAMDLVSSDKVPLSHFDVPSYVINAYNKVLDRPEVQQWASFKKSIQTGFQADLLKLVSDEDWLDMKQAVVHYSAKESLLQIYAWEGDIDKILRIGAWLTDIPGNPVQLLKGPVDGREAGKAKLVSDLLRLNSDVKRLVLTRYSLGAAVGDSVVQAMQILFRRLSQGLEPLLNVRMPLSDDTTQMMLSFCLGRKIELSNTQVVQAQNNQSVATFNSQALNYERTVLASDSAWRKGSDQLGLADSLIQDLKVFKGYESEFMSEKDYLIISATQSDEITTRKNIPQNNSVNTDADDYYIILE